MSIPVIDTLHALGNFPVVNSDEVQCGNYRLDVVLNQSATALAAKADKTYVDTNFAKKSEIPTDYGTYSKPSGGIPKTDLSSAVQASLGKADTALQSEQYTGTYSKPSGGIPKSDLASAVQTSLGKADTAIQTHQDISGKADKTYVDSELVKKATTAQLNTKADKSTVDTVSAAVDSKADKSTMSSLSGRVDDVETEQVSLSARMDAFTALEEGSTTGDAELTDIRVGANGKTYESAGSAVRNQISALSSNIDYLSKSEHVVSCGLWEQGTINTSTGAEVASTKYARTDFISVDSSEIYGVYNGNAMCTAVSYSASKSFISSSNVTNMRFKADGAYVRLVYFIDGETDVQVSDAEKTTLVNYVGKSNSVVDLENVIVGDGNYNMTFDWEHGLIDMTTGVDRTNRSAKYARTIGYMTPPTDGYVTFSCSVVKNVSQTGNLTIYYYNENKEFVKQESVTGKKLQILYPYFRLVYFYTSTPVDVEIADAETSKCSYIPTINDDRRDRIEKCLFTDGKFVFNSNDIVWASGLIDMTTGVDRGTINYKYAKTVGFLKNPTNKPVNFVVPTPVVNTSEEPALTIYYYNENKEFVSVATATNREITIAYPYFRLVYYYKNTQYDVDLTDAKLVNYSYAPELKLPVTVSNLYTRNKYVAFGDSITWGHLSGDGTGSGRATNPYPTVVGNSLGFDVTYGAQTGCGWVQPSGVKTAVSIIDAFNCAGYNLATLAFGTNDWYGNIPLGSISDTGTTTVYGAMKHCVEKILSDNPSICLIVITPINAKHLKTSDNVTHDNAGNYRYDTANTQGITLKQICAAEVAVAEYYGLPYIDNSKGSIVNRQNVANGSIFIDTLHPTNDFYKTLGQYYSGKIGGIFRPFSE